MKWVIRVVIALLLIVIIAVTVLFMYIDTIAKRAIVYAAEYSTGCKTTLAQANVGILKGSLSLVELSLYNHPGFGDTKFLELQRGKTSVKLSSLREDTVIIPLLELNDLTLNIIDEHGKNNYKPIFDHMEKLQKEAAKTKEGDTTSETGKKQKGFIIKEILIKNIKVNARVNGMDIPIKIDMIKLNDIGSNTDSGVVLSQVSGIIIQAIIKALIRNAPEVLPNILLNGLKEGMGGVGNIGDYSFQTLGNMVGQLPGGEPFQKALGGMGGATNQIFQESGKGLQDLGKGIGGIFGLGGDKDQAKKDSKEEKK